MSGYLTFRGNVFGLFASLLHCVACFTVLSGRAPLILAILCFHCAHNLQCPKLSHFKLKIAP